MVYRGTLTLDLIAIIMNIISIRKRSSDMDVVNDVTCIEFISRPI